MAQPFRFEPLLDWAGQREEQETRALAAVAREEQAARDALVVLEREREHEWAQFAGRNAPFDTEAYRVAVAYVQLLTERIEAQQAVLADAQARMAAARDVLLETMKEKQSFEHLRDRDAADAAREEGRREASRQDDLNMTRHVRHSASDRGAA